MWEQIDANTWRMWVEVGWLVKTDRDALTFVPDSTGQWTLSEKPLPEQKATIRGNVVRGNVSGIKT